jgi:hypothetical protein
VCCAKCFLWYNNEMILVRRKCRDCGFLCIKSGGAGHTVTKEYLPKERVEGTTNLFSGYVMPCCYRHSISFETELDKLYSYGGPIYPKSLSAALQILIEKSRNCSLFTKYMPGYDPEMHLSKFEVIEREKSNRRWNLIWLLVGAALTLIAGIVARLVFPTQQ